MRSISHFKVINFHSFTDPSVAFSEMCTDQFYIHRVRADTGSDPDKDYFDILTAQRRYGTIYNNAMDEYELNLITCAQHELELNTQLIGHYSGMTMWTRPAQQPIGGTQGL